MGDINHPTEGYDNRSVLNTHDIVKQNARHIKLENESKMITIPTTVCSQHLNQIAARHHTELFCYDYYQKQTYKKQSRCVRGR